MHGNVWEWCSDWNGEYPKGAVSDPVGPKMGSSHVCRGGGSGSKAPLCRSAFRFRLSQSQRVPAHSPTCDNREMTFLRRRQIPTLCRNLRRGRD
ncbi:MAG: formylglycine-generating enzyme family protein [Planctomycetota bacterium]